MTFSILAIDKKENSIGAAGFSHWLALGSISATVQSGKGVIISQGQLRREYETIGIKYLNTIPPKEIIAKISKDDINFESRQIGIIDIHGDLHAHTGKDCINFSSHYIGEGYIIQGNILSNKNVLNTAIVEMEKNDIPLEKRMLNALKSAYLNGGEVRGALSSYIKSQSIMKNTDAYEDIKVDLRVDFCDTPIENLIQLYDIRLQYILFEEATKLFEENKKKKSLNNFKKLFDDDNCLDEFKFWFTQMFKEQEVQEINYQSIKNQIMEKSKWKTLNERLNKL